MSMKQRVKGSSRRPMSSGQRRQLDVEDRDREQERDRQPLHATYAELEHRSRSLTNTKAVVDTADRSVPISSVRAASPKNAKAPRGAGLPCRRRWAVTTIVGG
jgi:hypothetical protein